jgi:hypothetical protein
MFLEGSWYVSFSWSDWKTVKIFQVYILPSWPKFEIVTSWTKLRRITSVLTGSSNYSTLSLRCDKNNLQIWTHSNLWQLWHVLRSGSKIICKASGLRFLSQICATNNIQLTEWLISVKCHTVFLKSTNFSSVWNITSNRNCLLLLAKHLAMSILTEVPSKTTLHWLVTTFRDTASVCDRKYARCRNSVGTLKDVPLSYFWQITKGKLESLQILLQLSLRV